MFSFLNDYRGIPSQALLLIILSFVPSIVIGFLYTDLSYFLPNVQWSGIPSSTANLWLGVTIGVMASTLVVVSLPLGILADRYGRRKMLIIGNVAASLSLVGFALTANLALILVVAVIEGIGEAAFAVSASALLADLAGDEKRTVAFSLIAFLGWIAGALGAFAVRSVISLQSIGLSNAEAHIALYLTIGLVGLSVTPFVLRIQEKPRTITPGQRERRGFLPKKSAPVLKRFLFCSVLIALGAGLFVPLMANWFFHAYGVTDAVSGPVLGISGILTAVAVFLSPKLARKFGIVRAIVMTQAVSTIFMVMVPTAPSFEAAASIYTVRVFLMNLSNPLSQSMIMGLVAPEERGVASGVSASLWRLPNAASSTVGAYWIGLGLLSLPFYVATILYVCSISSFWFLFKNAKLPEEKQKIVEPLEPLLFEEEQSLVASQ